MARAFRENETAIKRLLARFLPRRPDVEDLAQETFLRAYAAEAVQDIAAPRAFLLATARNLAINESRRAFRTQTAALEDFPAPDVIGSERQPSGDDEVHGRQKLTVFAAAIAALPEQRRRVFVLRKVHGLSQKEVAAKLGLSESTVEKHVAAGLLQTSDYLRRRGFETGPQDTSTVLPLKRGRKVGSADG